MTVETEDVLSVEAEASVVKAKGALSPGRFRANTGIRFITHYLSSFFRRLGFFFMVGSVS